MTGPIPNARSASVDALLARVRDAVRAQPVTVREVPSHAMVRRVARDSANLADLFATKAATVGMRVTRTDDTGLDAALTQLLEKRGKTVVAVRDALLTTRATTAVNAAGARLAANDNDDLLFDCEVGITDVDCAIAESGSLVISTNGRIRNAWITPPIHIAIVRADQILPDLVDLFELRADTINAASTTIITGPSKTADIEGVLVTGVHGPAAVEIVLVG
ncbi:MAG: LUD domain-containing protein [Limnohabitans sp.]|nr:LUD domain-containing protein [Limnohabitans sp.]